MMGSKHLLNEDNLTVPELVKVIGEILDDMKYPITSHELSSEIRMRTGKNITSRRIGHAMGFKVPNVESRHVIKRKRVYGSKEYWKSGKAVNLEP